MSLYAMCCKRFDGMLCGARVALDKVARPAGLSVLRKRVSSWVRPVHAAFILDGNRRYAMNAKLTTYRMGHEMGTQRFYGLIELCHQYGIPNLSVYSFSIENFKRSQTEITALFDILRTTLNDMATPGNLVHRLGCRIRIIGDRAMVPAEVSAAMQRAEHATQHHAAMTVFIGVAYDGREEIVQAARRCVAEAVSSSNDARGAASVASAITIEAMTRHMYLRAHEASVPPVDLVVRAGGAKRLSSFLMWDASHAELHFDPVLWPEFGEFEFLRALSEFNKRQASSQTVDLRYSSKEEPQLAEAKQFAA